MQIIPTDKYLAIISENPTESEEKKVQTYYWIDIKEISFIHPQKSIWRTVKTIAGLIFGFLVGADIIGVFNSTFTIVLLLKKGEKVSFEYQVHSKKEAKEFEQKLLSYK